MEEYNQTMKTMKAEDERRHAKMCEKLTITSKRVRELTLKLDDEKAQLERMKVGRIKEK